MAIFKCIISHNAILFSFDEFIFIFGKNVFDFLIKKLTISFTQELQSSTIINKTIKLYRFVLHNEKKFVNISRFCNLGKILKEKVPDVKIKYINKINQGLSFKDKLINESQSKYVKLATHQQICFDYLIKNVYNEEKIKKGLSSCVFIMDTGLGKTYLAVSLIEHFGEKTLIIIPNGSILQGWKEALSKYLHMLNVGEYCDSKKKDGDIVLMIINSALSDVFKFDKNEDNDILYTNYFKSFGFVIFDEIQNYSTDFRNNIFWRTNFKYCLGLTATPDERLDKMDIIYKSHVGPLIFATKIDEFQKHIQSVEWKGIVNVINYYGPKEYTKNIKNTLGLIDVQKIQKQFVNDPYRVQLILNLIIEKVKENRNVFVFTINRRLIENLYDFLIKLNIFKKSDKKIAKFFGGISENEKIETKEFAQVVLATYSFGKEGVSINKMDTIILAQPIRNKMRQIIGRILRYGSDVSIIREIIDIRDMCTSIKNQFSTRKQIYKERKFDIKTKIVKYDTIKLSSKVKINEISEIEEIE